MSKKIIILVIIAFLYPMNVYAVESKYIEMLEMNRGKIVEIVPLTSQKFVENCLHKISDDLVEATYVVKQEKREDANNVTKQELVGQLNIGKSRIELPNPKGHNIYRISVRGGRAILYHRSYNPDGHTWSIPPQNNEAQYINITDSKTHYFEINIDKIHGQMDKVFLVNPSLRGSIDVEYMVKEVISR